MPEVISAPAMPQCGFRGPPWGISGGITADDVGLNAAARRFRTMKVLGKESRIFPFWKNRAYPSSERDRTFPLASLASRGRFFVDRLGWAVTAS